jgi:hypothetical protein
LKNQNIELTHKFTVENGEIVTLSRDLEIKVKEHEITIDELRKHLEISRQKEFKEWLEGVIQGDGLNYVYTEHADRHKSMYDEFLKLKSKPPQGVRELRHATGVDVSLNTDAGIPVELVPPSTVAELVMDLLKQWREFAASSPAGRMKAISTVSALNKADQRFLQRVADLVMSANERCIHMESALRGVEIEKAQSDLALRVCRDRLVACAEHLDRYRRRAEVAERVVSVDRKGLVITPGKLVTLLRKSVNTERTAVLALQNELLSEKRDRKMREIELKAEQLHLRKVPNCF